MNVLLLAALFATPIVNLKSVQPGRIKLDGIIEPEWSEADSVDSLTQYRPYYNRKASWRTVFKFLQDNENLYILVVAYTDGQHPASKLSGRTDEISVFLDPIGDRNTCYEFNVSADGRYDDSFFYNDGSDEDHSWDGFWFYKVKVLDDRYIVEMKIPFRTVRFRPGLESWGLQLQRVIPQLHEVDYWVLPSQEKGFQVSIFGKLEGVKPGARGLGMELYPVVFFRYDYYDNEFHPNPGVGLDFSYSLSSNTRINLTVHPDFAQIESDPYALNLSKYERWLPERRPFFIEAQDIFALSKLQYMEFVASPVQPFYSRRIGKKLPDGTEIPIIFGSKITARTRRVDYGVMLVQTGGASYEYMDEGYWEPGYLWNVTRFNFKFGRSNVGFFYGNKTADSTGWPSANIVALDGGLRNDVAEVVYQVFRSNVDGEIGDAWFVGIAYEKNDWSFSARVHAIGEDFDPTPIGRFRSALPGDTAIGFSPGHVIRFDSGDLSRLWFGIGESISREGSEPWCKGIGMYGGGAFRSGYDFHAHMRFSEDYEFGEKRPTVSLSIGFDRWGSDFRYGLNLNFWRGWNYSRWYMREDSQYVALYAWMGSGNVWLSFPLTDRISAGISTNSWLEYDSTNSLIAVTTSLRPSISYSISPHMDVSVSSYLTYRKDVTDDDRYIQKGALINGQLGVRFTYDFRPKSKLYVVLNLHTKRPDDAGSQTDLVKDFGVAAVKVRWAIPF